jgi:anti-sigma factor ChrR (cupin superfamily)
MVDDSHEVTEFDDLLAVALAEAAGTGEAPGRAVRDALFARLAQNPAPVPRGFAFRSASDGDWLPHPVPGIRMKVLALNRKTGYAMLLLDAAPGTRFPPHHHGGAEECYVVSGTVYTCNRRMTAGDFLHADGDTDHGDLWTDEGARVILVIPPDDELPAPAHD